VLPLALGVATAEAVPEASHVRLECEALRLNVNNYTLRHQISLVVTVSAADEAEFAGLGDAELSVSDPTGTSVTLGPAKQSESPRRFKAAHARLKFRAISDPADPGSSNVPAGFFDGDGPFSLSLSLLGKTYRGEVAFNRRLGMSVLQLGEAATTFTLRSGAPFEIYTTPAEFGPVYYKQQDITNFMFQLANMYQSLESQDYHTPVENPLYLFQIGVCDGEGGPTSLLDPARYIEGYEPHLIRSESTATPLRLEPQLFGTGDVIVVDFRRQDRAEPDSVFASDNPDLTDQLIVEDRVIFALEINDPPPAMGSW
jgi:hypothetical protein